MPNYVVNRIYFKKNNVPDACSYDDCENIDEKRMMSILERIKYDEGLVGTVDFNKIIPMPETLNITSGGRSSVALDVYLSCINPLNIQYKDIKKISRSRYYDIKSKASRGYFGKINDTMSKEEITKAIEDYCAEIATKKYPFKISKYEFTLLDYGKTIVENVEKYGTQDWYSWSCKFWGTKWNSCDGTPYEDNCVVNFQTAWSPSLPITQKLSEMYPDVLFLHYWADEDFGANTGIVTFLNGDEIIACLPETCSKEAMEIAAELWDTDISDMYYYDEKNNEYVYITDYCRIKKNVYDELVTKRKLIRKNLFIQDEENKKDGFYRLTDDSSLYEWEELKKIYEIIYTNGFKVL